MFDLFTTEKIG